MSTEKSRLWDLLAARHRGELPTEEEAELQQLSRKFPEELSSLGRITTGLDHIKTASKVNQAQSWELVQKQIRRNQIRRLTFTSFKYAAIIIVSLLVGYLIQTNTIKQPNNQYAEVEVMYGQMGHLFLFDGTEVWLNSGSRLKYPSQFNQDERDVILEGEGFFKVAKNKHLPFKVKTRKMEVEVLGTSFDVCAYEDEDIITVVLEEGKVRLNQPNGKEIATMKPGELAELDKTGNELAIMKVNTSYYTNWKEGTLEFRGESLGEIAKRLERWYNVQITIEDPSLVDCKITGTVLRNKPVEQIMQAFEFLAPIRTQYISKPNQKDIINIYKK